MHKMDKLNDITLSMEVENKINCHIDKVISFSLRI